MYQISIKCTLFVLNASQVKANTTFDNINCGDIMWYNSFLRKSHSQERVVPPGATAINVIIVPPP